MKTESSNSYANPLEAIRSEFETIPDTTDIGMLSIKSANRTLEDAARRPDPEQLYLELWYEGEVCCLFADSNLGKSIFAVQMADTISRTRRVLYVDCELSDKQFQLRYTDKETGERHLFPDNLFRAEINPCAIGVERYEENIIKDIEMAAIRTSTNVIIIDNLTYLCNSSNKGVDAGLFMMNLMNLKKKYGWSLLIIAHPPQRSLMSPITQNDLAGSKKLYNFFDSVFAIGQSAKDKRPRCFTLYSDDKGNALHPTVGRCDHESSCAYHYTPRQYFHDHPEHRHFVIPSERSESRNLFHRSHRHGRLDRPSPGIIPPALIPPPSGNNHLITYLKTLLPSSAIDRIIADYRLLEDNATRPDRAAHIDLADWIIQFLTNNK